MSPKAPAPILSSTSTSAQSTCSASCSSCVSASTSSTSPPPKVEWRTALARDPASRSSCTHWSWFFLIASSIGVWPHLSAALTSAPWRSSSLTTSAWPSDDARCIGERRS
eukprot:6184587-Pleurochrysis_carterae.AAC.3